MTPAEIADERRRGRLAGSAAIAAGILAAVSIVWGAVVNHHRPNGTHDDAERLRFFDHHSSGLIANGVVSAIGFALLVFAIVHLHRATKGRNPELTLIPLVLGVFGALALALGSIGQAVALAAKASDFVTQQFHSSHAADEAAKHLTDHGLPLATRVISLVGALSLAAWFVLGSLNAMGVGLLTRFMGIIGIIVGAGFVFGFAPPLMVFWLIGLGAIFLGRWPGGLPPAWETGVAKPWQKRQPPEQEAPAAEEDGSRNGEVNAVGPGVREPEEPDVAAASKTQPRRKRKRRI